MKKIILITLALCGTLLNASEILDLDECVQLALNNNLSLQKSKLALQQSEILTDQAWSALYPNVSASASTSNSGPVVSEVADEMNWNISGGINQSFYRPGMYTGISLANERLTASEYSNVSLQNQIRATVEKYYFQILALDTLVGVYHANIKLSEEQISKMEQLVDLGMRRESDLLKARVQRGTFESQLVRERESLASSKRALNNLMGREPHTEFNIQVLAIDEISIPDYQTAMLAMIESNPDLQSLKSNIEQKKLSLTIAKEAYLPSLYGSYSYSRSNDPFGIDDYVESDRMSLNLSIDLFDGFNKSQNIQINRLNLIDAEVDYNASLKDLKENLLNQYNALSTQNSLIEIHQTNLESARKDLAVVSEQYAGGLSTVLDLTDAQVAVLESETSLLTDKYTRKQIEAEILRLIGK